MNLVSFVQVSLAFVAGGSFMAILSILAERSNDRIAGIIMMFPTTIVFGFFFLGWVTSPTKVALIVPSTLMPLGLVVFSSAIYIYTAKFISQFKFAKRVEILLSFFTSILIWLALAVPFALFKFSNLIYGIAGYSVLSLITYHILNLKQNGQDLPRPIYNTKQKIFRAVFMGSMIAVVVLLAKCLNLFWGGLFTMFPAATFSALITFHFYYEPNRLFFFMKRAPVGSISLFLYTISVMLLFPLIGIFFGTIGAYGVSLISSLILIQYYTAGAKCR